MTAQDPSDFAYQPIPETSDLKRREHYWNTAFGLQAVDGLSPSRYLVNLASKNIAGELSLAETGTTVRRYYVEAEADSKAFSLNEKEADLVSQRIAELLAARKFFFMPSLLASIHKSLFQDLSSEVYLPGIYKAEPLIKQETILNGDSVLYADPTLVEQSLEYLFTEERQAYYGIEFSAETLARLATFVAHIWQVHPFVEGNTRTVAVFTELYLDHLGFEVRNDSFVDNARYFRDALVRANYRNAPAKILPEKQYLARFFENLLCGAQHQLDSKDLHCQALFTNPSLLRNVDSSLALNLS